MYILCILLGILITIVGVIMITKPRMIYEFTQNWKNSSYSGPSEDYIRYIRLKGIWFVIVGVFGTLVLIFLA